MSDPRSSEVVISKLDSSRRDEAIAVLARAFWPDPLFGFFARGLLQEYSMLAKVFGAFMADAVAFDEIDVAMAGDRVVGCAVWTPPSGLPRSKQREAMLQARVARLLVTGQNRRLGLQLLDALQKVHPHEPHWYLLLLGADPLVQGRGIGGRLMTRVLDQCDTEGLPAYLETQKESNLAFYGRYGFEVADEISLPNCPPAWTMMRRPVS